MGYGLVCRLNPLAGIVVAMILSSACANGQAASDYQIKAAYLYNFAKFVEWPSQNFLQATTPLRFCIFDDRYFETELNRIVSGKVINARGIEVMQVEDAEQSRMCHVLFINAAHDRQQRRLLERLKGAAILTVGEAEDFLENGGIIRFVLRDDRIQFEINRRAAATAGLRISSRLLGVAKRVIQ
jgi:hypothetical protein